MCVCDYILHPVIGGHFHYSLQIIYRYWERNDVKGVIVAMEKMADHAVSVVLDYLSSIFPRLAHIYLFSSFHFLKILDCGPNSFDFVNFRLLQMLLAL